MWGSIVMKDFGDVPPQRHLTMSHIRSKDTKPEVTLRKALWHKGYRYRKNLGSLPGKPDIVLTQHRICIFVDSEFFHGFKWGDGMKERLMRGSNPGYWIPKIERNMRRDRETDLKLKELGRKVLHFWARDVEKNLEQCILAVSEAVCCEKPGKDKA